jgi:hypothetical protein
MRLITALTVALVTAFPAAALAATPEAKAPPSKRLGVSPDDAQCDRYAGPKGIDRRGRGSRRRPLRSVPRLAMRLRAGETGCLLPGRYRHHFPAKLSGARTKLIGLEGGARVDGAIWVTERARRAQVRGLDLTASDRTFFIPLKVQASGVRIAGNRIRGSRSTTCVLVGSTRRARGVRIERNWIHHCGRRGKLDHLIYVQDASGTLIRGNVLTDNPGGWAVHLYPNADHSRIERNLMNGNQGGVIFAGVGPWTSDHNTVRSNVITGSSPRRNVEASWGDAVGIGNVVDGNCLFSTGLDAPTGIGSPVGFTAGPTPVRTTSPYAASREGEYRFPSRSECGSYVVPLTAVFPHR